MSYNIFQIKPLDVGIHSANVVTQNIALTSITSVNPFLSDDDTPAPAAPATQSQPQGISLWVIVLIGFVSWLLLKRKI